MATNTEKDKPARTTIGRAEALTNRNILSSIISGVELNADQKAEIKNATGVDVEWLLFHHAGGAAARDFHRSSLSVITATWCW